MQINKNKFRNMTMASLKNFFVISDLNVYETKAINSHSFKKNNLNIDHKYLLYDSYCMCKIFNLPLTMIFYTKLLILPSVLQIVPLIQFFLQSYINLKFDKNYLNTFNFNSCLILSNLLKDYNMANFSFFI